MPLAVGLITPLLLANNNNFYFFYCFSVHIYIYILKKGLSTYFFSAKNKKKVLIFSFELYVLSLFLSLLCNLV